MAATLTWYEDNGPAVGSPPHGTSTTASVGNVDWKNADDTTTPYTSVPITAGDNSYQKNQYGRFGGTFELLFVGYFANTSASVGPNVSLKGVGACTTSDGPYAYVTPSTAVDANLVTDMSSPVAIDDGIPFWFSPTGPHGNDLASSTAVSPSWTNWLTTQLQTTGPGTHGVVGPIVLELAWDEF